MYIDHHMMDRLLDSYNVLKALLKSMQIELDNAYIQGTMGNDDEVIYALVMGNRNIENPIRSTSITDKTSKVAITYKKSVDNTNRTEIERITNEMLQIHIMIDKMDLAIESLPTDDKTVIDQVYLQEIPWTNSTKPRDKKHILQKVCCVARIPEELFYEVIDKIKK